MKKNRLSTYCNAPIVHILYVCVHVMLHFLEPSPHLAKAICLRGTWFTLMSMHNEAIQDFDRVISLEDAPVKVKM